MERYSKKLLNFELRFATKPRHRGEQFRFCPSENLENSRSMGASLRAVPPVGYISCTHSADAVRILSLGCELNFILYATGIPEPSDKELSEGSHSLSVCENSKLKYLCFQKNWKR